jgi:hypothetical protein
MSDIEQALILGIALGLYIAFMAWCAYQWGRYR